MEILKNIHWLHHASFRIEYNGKVIYIDPWKLKSFKKADYIFITHEHFDHFSINDIEKIIKESTLIIAPEEVVKELKGNKYKKVIPGEKFELEENLSVEVVPAYNIDKNFHPKNTNKVGYILKINDIKIYHAGDTDFIPEMKELKNINIALLPVGGTYTMDYNEASKFAEIVKPDIIIPMHYGEIVGNKKDAEELKRLVKSSKVEILKPEE